MRSQIYTTGVMYINTKLKYTFSNDFSYIRLRANKELHLVFIEKYQLHKKLHIISSRYNGKTSTSSR